MKSEALGYRRFSVFLGLLTGLWSALFAGASIWDGLSVTTPFFIKIALWALTPCGVVALIPNIILAGVCKNRRWLHLAFSCTIVLAFAFSWFATGWHMRSRQKWFLHDGLVIYEDAVSKILQNKALLTYEPKNLNDLVDHDSLIQYPIKVFGKTNADGSVTIWFAGRDASARMGYLYHSGGRLATDPGDPQHKVLHLTNGWYEY